MQLVFNIITAITSSMSIWMLLFAYLFEPGLRMLTTKCTGRWSKLARLVSKEKDVEMHPTSKA